MHQTMQGTLHPVFSSRQLLLASTAKPVTHTAEVAVNGVFDVTKEAPLVIAVGARVFWDNTNKRVTTTATGNVAIGHAVAAAASADTTVRVRLSGSTPAGT